MSTVAMVSSILPRTHYTRHLFAELSKIRPDTALLTEENPELEEYRREVGCGNIIGLWRNGWRLPLALRRYCRTHSVKFLHLQHEFNMYHRDYKCGALIFLLTLLLSRARGRKVIVTMHAVVSCSQTESDVMKVFELPWFLSSVPVFRTVLKGFYGLAVRCSDVMVVHGEALKEILVAEYGLNPNRCAVIPHGVASLRTVVTPPMSLRHRSGELLDRRIILTFGYLVRRKGIEDLLYAFQIARKELGVEWSLVIAGASLGGRVEYERELHALSVKLGLSDSVVFTGFVTEEELSFLVSRSEIVVAPHAVSVSSSGVVALAIGAGKPVIVSDQPAFREIFEENRDALFFRSGDTEGLGAKLLALTRDARLRQELSAGANRLREKLSWSRIAAMHSEILYA